MGTLAGDDFLDFQLRRNRLDGSGLYFGHRGRLGPVAGPSLAPFLHDWVTRNPHKRMGVIPLMAERALDDGRAHELDALLGDRVVDYQVDDDGVVSGLALEQLERALEGKVTAMRPDDDAAFRELAARHGISFEGLLDGPWTALLVRIGQMGVVPSEVVLAAGIGMRPKMAKGLALPHGFEIWEQSESWRFVGRQVAAVAEPERTATIDLGAVRRAMAEAQAAVLDAARGELWRKRIAKEQWTEADLEILLCVHLPP